MLDALRLEFIRSVASEFRSVGRLVQLKQSRTRAGQPDFGARRQSSGDGRSGTTSTAPTAGEGGETGSGGRRAMGAGSGSCLGRPERHKVGVGV
jgi:hypothetical protein